MTLPSDKKAAAELRRLAQAMCSIVEDAGGSIKCASAFTLLYERDPASKLFLKSNQLSGTSFVRKFPELLVLTPDEGGGTLSKPEPKPQQVTEADKKGLQPIARQLKHILERQGGRCLQAMACAELYKQHPASRDILKKLSTKPSNLAKLFPKVLFSLRSPHDIMMYAAPMVNLVPLLTALKKLPGMPTTKKTLGKKITVFRAQGLKMDSPSTTLWHLVAAKIVTVAPDNDKLQWSQERVDEVLGWQVPLEALGCPAPRAASQAASNQLSAPGSPSPPSSAPPSSVPSSPPPSLPRSLPQTTTCTNAATSDFSSAFCSMLGGGLLSGTIWTTGAATDTDNEGEGGEAEGDVDIVRAATPEPSTPAPVAATPATVAATPAAAAEQQPTHSDQVLAYRVIDTVTHLDQSIATLQTAGVLVMDCEGVPDALPLIQVATSEATFVFDCVTLGEKTVVGALGPLLADETKLKVLHDLHQDVVALARVGDVQLHHVMDTQLAYEVLNGDPHAGLNKVLNDAGVKVHGSKYAMHRDMDRDSKLFERRPLAPRLAEYAALDVSLLLNSVSVLTERLSCTQLQQVLRASQKRAQRAVECGGHRHIGFPPLETAVQGEKWVSLELLEAKDETYTTTAPTLDADQVESLIQLLPDRFRWACLADPRVQQDLIEIIVEQGRRPYAVFGVPAPATAKGRKTSREFLVDDADAGEASSDATTEDITHIVEQLGENAFGNDNRSGISGCLHRISAMRNRSDDIYGLTLRVGRAYQGLTHMIQDVLFGMPEQSVLLLGKPGAGKTTVIRDACRWLSEHHTVIIVDTSNEIAGQGDEPHPCIGAMTRRMMVPSLERQKDTMIECVQNHTPEIMVVDEIGRAQEVQAARTVKNRGVRMIASAHGDFSKLMKNGDLKGLLGHVKGVIETGGKPKTKRVSEPTFDVVVELHSRDEWTVIRDVGRAVDDVLAGKPYLVERRKRFPDGAMTLQFARRSGKYL
eukprot:m.457510 g.457510  ORF g.457510 m.457510 type:complete len:980 (-) comp20333_c0_seq9:56-2995(-)